ALLDQPLHHLGLDLQGAATAMMGFLAEHHYGLAADIADQAGPLNGGLGVQAASQRLRVNRMFARHRTSAGQDRHQHEEQHSRCDEENTSAAGNLAQNQDDEDSGSNE